jgi:hypothetical protein
MTEDFYHLMARWKILEAIAADVVPVNENPGLYGSYVLSPEAEKLLKIDLTEKR